jgi:NAD(P)-dependent dehydrogenase (short-subunit alcohol dehydrogenase family)
MNKREFVNKVIVVTGGAKGIGACIAQTFIDLGANVIFSDIDAEAGQEREELLNQRAGVAQAKFIPADLRESEQVGMFCHQVLENSANINLIINNAGFFKQTALLKRPLAEWDDVIALNLRATYLCSQLLSQALISTKGSIINIASTRALMSEHDTEPYSASKGGIVALTHSLAISLGKFGVRVNAISPGWIETSLWQLPPKTEQLRPIDHEQHPVGRVGRPEDIAQACLFLASDIAAGFITGHNLVVDGGMTKKMIYVE